MITKEKLHEIIFEAETPAGKAFDLFLLFVLLIFTETTSSAAGGVIFFKAIL